MKINTGYSVPAGEEFSCPSITCPDLSYSIEDLVTQFSVGQIPPLARLQTLYDDDEEMTGANDLRSMDLTDMYSQIEASNNILEIVKKKVETMRKWRTERDANT